MTRTVTAESTEHTHSASESVSRVLSVSDSTATQLPTHGPAETVSYTHLDVYKRQS